MNPDPIHEQLQSLPDLPPPDSLWPRLAQRQRRIRQRQQAGTVLAAAAAFAGVLFFALPHADLSQQPVPALARTTPATRLQAVDHALQAAYARGASDDELAPLWDIRQQLASVELPSPAQGELP